MAEHVMTLRELNRATLARQSLLERASLTPGEMIRQLIAMQGQVPNDPYIGLWSRLQAFQRDDLTHMLAERQVVRASSLRVTLHVMLADDYLCIHPLLQMALSRNLHIFAGQTAGFDMQQFSASMQAYVREQPRTSAELRVKMEELYPGMGRLQIVDSLRMYLALIQAFPAGTWNFTGRLGHTLATEWLGRPLVEVEGGLHYLVKRYLAAFGPASVRDMQMWSRLSKLQPAFDALRPELLTFRDEHGRELFDLPDAPRPSADTPAPVRFLPVYENSIIGYADRRRILPDEYRSYQLMLSSNICTVLVDGFVRGMWKIERKTPGAKLIIEPLAPLSDNVRSALIAEGERLMGFVQAGADPFEIQFVANKMNGL